MPTRERELFLELIRVRPSVAAALLDCVRPGLTPKFAQAKLESGGLSEQAPAACHADAVVTLGDETPDLAVIVEVQLRVDRRKHLSWPASVATARAHLGCPTVLLAICPEAGVARWARQPIELGHPGLELTPLVLGPEETPVFADGSEAAMPELSPVGGDARSGATRRGGPRRDARPL